MKYPSEIHEGTERKILRECAYTRNKHIEIEERYEKLVSRKASKIDLSALENVLRKKEKIKEAEPEKHTDEPEKKKLSEKPKEVTFDEILKLQASMMNRMAEQSSSDFCGSLFDDEKSTDKKSYPVYNEPLIIKKPAEAAGEEALEEAGEDLGAEDVTEEIEAVEVEEIILPEDAEGVGLVFVTPIENQEVKETPAAAETGLKKSVGAMILAAAVLVGGVLLVCMIWPI